MYQLEYLPSARNEMDEISRYISQELHNPSAAKKLAAEMKKAAESLAEFPYRHPVHRASVPLKHEYRKLLVKNYIMFYYVDEEAKIVVIARVIYSRRDYERFL